MTKTIIRFLLCYFFIFGQTIAFAQSTAAILPQGKTQFLDNNGDPLSSGKVYFYIPSTTTFKTTWQDSAKSVANTNPVILDAGGRAIIYGDGTYRQILRDRNNNTIYDAITASAGTGGGTTGTGDGDLVGTVKPWAGLQAPNQYAFAYGQEISRTTYSVLYTAITSQQNITCASGSPIASGFSDTSQFPVGAVVESLCFAPGTTVISKTTTTVTFSNNSSLSSADTVRIFLYGNGNGSTTFNLPDLRGYVVAGRCNMGGTACTNLTSVGLGETTSATGAAGGTQIKVLLGSNLPAYTPVGTIVTTGTISQITPAGSVSTPTITVSGGNLVIASGGATYNLALSGSSGQNSNVTATSSTPTFTGTPVTPTFSGTSTFTGTAQGGTSTAFSIVQPTLTLNYIIKITPDSNSADASGVTSLGEMTGDIACGNGILCTGNIISSTIGTLNQNQIFVGNASNLPISVPMSGDCTIVASGAISCTTSDTSNCMVYSPVGGDNTSAFNTAATNAVAAGKTLCVLGGTIASPLVISIATTMSLPSGLQLKCGGEEVTIFRKTANSAGVTFVSIGNTTGIFIEDCTFDLNGQNNLLTAQYYGVAGNAPVNNFTMNRVTIKNPFNGALLEIVGDGSTPTVPNTNQLSSNVKILNSTFDGSNTGVNPAAGDFLDIVQVNGLWFINNKVIGGASNGSCAANGLVTGYNRNFWIENNKVTNCYRGIYNETSQDGVFKNNVVYNTANIAPAFANLKMYGMWLVDANQTYSGGGYGGSQRITIHGNHVYNLNRATGNTGIDCYTLSAPAGALAAQDIIFNSNSCFSSGVADHTGTTAGIRLEGASDTISVKDNSFRDLTTPSIGVSTTSSYTSSGMGAAQSTINIIASDNLCTSITPCQTVPTVTTCTMNTGATCALATGSTDEKGLVTVTAGATGTATATLTLTYSAKLGANSSNCNWQTQNGSGGFTAPVTLFGTGAGTTSNTISVTNGANFTPSSTYGFMYQCIGF